ncbi:hypothetical protein C882_3225 [Caenispirillum salinarum AK4]|uniref:DUF805 domain-containing protein n=1 Tax=Caenispirillum salinarum AK4 TaxID=1238182 RepID=K9HVB9_9PROT|nr:DUF805 domain-containing protein [Caenispirillum salinarum]EKV32161.1 hypothetical protein C882_3225 [Caenispirillum salinarum AK4]
MKILRTLFGNLRHGTMHRVPFFWHIAGLWAVGGAAVMAVVVGMGINQPTDGMTPEQAGQAVRDALGPVVHTVLVVLAAVLVFAQVNIMAKRLRDTGLPGWLTLVAVVAVTGLVSGFISPAAGGLVNIVFWLALLFTPPVVFARRKSG